MFDPEQDYLDPPLQGYRLVDGAYAPIELDAEGYMASVELNLLLRIDDDALQFYRADTKERLLSAEERAERAEELSRSAADRSRRAEEEAAALREELERLRSRTRHD